jgi:hypothetical protein
VYRCSVLIYTTRQNQHPKLVLNWYYFCNDSLSYVIIARAFQRTVFFKLVSQIRLSNSRVRPNAIVKTKVISKANTEASAKVRAKAVQI